MARPVYSVLLLGGTIEAGSGSTVELAAGFVYVVRDINAVFSTSGVGSCTLHVTFDGRQIDYEWCAGNTFAEAHTWSGRCVAAGPTTITADVGGAGSVDVTISGYQLTP